MKQSKVYDYVVVLKNGHKKTITKTGWMLVALSVLPYAVILARNPKNQAIYFLLILLVSLLTAIVIDLKKKKQPQFMLFLLVAGMGIFYFSSMFFVGLMYVVAGLSEKIISQKKEIGFSATEIVFSGLLSKRLNWSALNNVLIKDGLLTMDYKNNTLFQAYTDDEDDASYEAGEDEFNEFCRKNLM